MAGGRPISKIVAPGGGLSVLGAVSLPARGSSRSRAEAGGSIGTAPKRFIPRGLDRELRSTGSPTARVVVLVRGPDEIFAAARRERMALAPVPSAAERLV